MSQALAVVGAALAWSGAVTVVLSDGRRGLGAGLLLEALGLAALEVATGAGVRGALILAGGIAAAGLRMRSGRPGWVVMPPGSTPRLVMSIATALAALWIAVAVIGGQSAPFWFAVLALIGLLTGHVITTLDATAAATATAGLALAVGTLCARFDPGGAVLLLAAGAGIAVLASSWPAAVYSTEPS